MLVCPRPQASRFEKVRRDHSTETAEDYVEAIHEFIRSQGQCRITDLAGCFAVSHVTVNRTVARLKREGLSAGLRKAQSED